MVFLESIRRILLVEDDAVIALARRRILESAGYAVTIAHTGDQALEIVSDSLPPDLILMDVDLGRGMDGTEAAKRILAHRSLPVVFLSSRTDPDVIARTEKIDSYGYIQKSAPDAILLTSLRVALRLSDAHRKAVESFQTGLESKSAVQLEVFEAIHDAIVVTDEFGVITYHNRVASELYQFAGGSAVGARIDAVIPCSTGAGSEGYPSVLCSIAEHARWTGERVISPPDGLQFTASVSNCPVLDAHGSLHAIVSVSRRLHYGSRAHKKKTDAHYLERELDALVQSDPEIFTFLREGSLDGMWYWDIEKPDHEWMDNRFWEL